MTDYQDPGEYQIDTPEEHENFAPDDGPKIGPGYPIGKFIGIGVEECVVGDLGEFLVDPATGCITEPKPA